jgi:molybdate transport system substrate-binding protein
MRALLLTTAMLMTTEAGAQDVRLFAAGSLRGVMSEVGAAYAQAIGIKVAGEFGASGLLRERLDRGEAADVFASANMEHPQLLAGSGKGGAVRRFTRNQMCVLAAPGLDVNTGNVIDAMLRRGVRLGTSTPKADPSGDYALEVFHKAGKLRPGADVALRARARQLTGGPDSPKPPKDRNVYAMLLGDRSADIFLTYCTNAIAARKENAALQVVQLPHELAVGADYGVIAFTPAGEGFADFLLTPAAQRIFHQHGFAAP